MEGAGSRVLREKDGPCWKQLESGAAAAVDLLSTAILTPTSLTLFLVPTELPRSERCK